MEKDLAKMPESCFFPGVFLFPREEHRKGRGGSSVPHSQISSIHDFEGCGHGLHPRGVGWILHRGMWCWRTTGTWFRCGFQFPSLRTTVWRMERNHWGTIDAWEKKYPQAGRIIFAYVCLPEEITCTLSNREDPGCIPLVPRNSWGLLSVST